MQLHSCEHIILFPPIRLKLCAWIEIFTPKDVALSWPGHRHWSHGDNRQFCPCTDTQQTLESNSSPSDPSFATLGEVKLLVFYSYSYSCFFLHSYSSSSTIAVTTITAVTITILVLLLHHCHRNRLEPLFTPKSKHALCCTNTTRP